MRRIALVLSLLIASSASAFALTEADLRPAERQLLASVKAQYPDEAPYFLITRAYVRQAETAATDPVAAANFHSQPPGFRVHCLLPEDADKINRAVTASIAAMAKSLWGK